MNTVEPIRDMDLVMDLADYLKSNNERDYVLFMFGIYTGLRISDILKFRVRDVKGKDAVYIREKKTGKEKRFPINSELRPVIDEYISGKREFEYLFRSPNYQNKAITRQQAYNILSGGRPEVWAGQHRNAHITKDVRLSYVPADARRRDIERDLQSCRHKRYTPVHWYQSGQQRQTD